MKVVEFATRRRVTILMVTVAVVLFGFVSLSRLKLNLLPDLSLSHADRAHRSTRAPRRSSSKRWSPARSRNRSAIIRNVRSVQALGLARRPGRRDARVRLGHRHGPGGHRRARQDRPAAAAAGGEPPVLLRFDPSTEPVMRYAFVDTDEFAKSNAAESGSVDRLKSLRRFADDRLKPDLESVDGSAAVKVSGGFEDEIQVFVDQQKLAQLNLSIDTVRSACARRTSTSPAAASSRAPSATWCARSTSSRRCSRWRTRSSPTWADGPSTCATSPPSRAATRTARRSRGSTAASPSSSPSTRKATPTPCSSPQAIRARVEELEQVNAGGSELKLVYDQSHVHLVGDRRGARGGADRRPARDPGPVPVPARRPRDLHHRPRDTGLGHRHLRADVPVRPVAQHHVARRHRARGRHAGRQLGRGAREHRRATARKAARGSRPRPAAPARWAPRSPPRRSPRSRCSSRWCSSRASRASCSATRRSP